MRLILKSLKVSISIYDKYLNEVNMITKRINLLKKLKDEINEMDDKEFLDIVKEVYEININELEFKEIAKRILKTQKIKRSERLLVDVPFKNDYYIKSRDGIEKRYMNISKERHFSYAKVYYSDLDDFNKYKVYTGQELKRLVDSKKVVIRSFKDSNLVSISSNNNFSLKDFTCLNTETLFEVKDYYKYIIPKLKKELSSERITLDIISLIKNAKEFLLKQEDVFKKRKNMGFWDRAQDTLDMLSYYEEEFTR